MATYYGYAERKVENEINWAEIGKNMTDMLANEARIREEKKAAIDKSSREFGETLANSPQGQHQGVNQWALNYASNAQEARLTQDRLLKSGMLKLRDYNIMRQNLTDGTTQAFGLIKEYNVKAEEKLKRMSAGLSAAQEQYEMEQIEGFGNFTNTELYINPTDYSVSVGKKVKGEDGVMMLSKNPNDFSSISSLRNQMNNKIDKYNVIGNLKVGVDALGKKTEVVMANGVKTRTNPKNLKDYNKVRDTYIDSLMTNSVNVGSILTDYVKLSPEGVAYGFTRDESNTDPNKILLVADPMNPASGRLVPKLTSKQEKVAKDALISQFDAMIDEQDTARAEFAPQRPVQPTAYERKMAQIQERNLKSVDYMNRVLSSEDERDVSAALGDLQSFNDNISKVEKVGNELVFSIYNPQRKVNEIQRVPLSGDKKDIAERALTKILGPDVNVATLVTESGIDLSGGVSNVEGKYERTVEIERKPLDSPESLIFDVETQTMTSPKSVIDKGASEGATEQAADAVKKVLSDKQIRANVSHVPKEQIGSRFSLKSLVGIPRDEKAGEVNIDLSDEFESVISLRDNVDNFKNNLYKIIDEINNAKIENRQLNEDTLNSLGAIVTSKNNQEQNTKSKPLDIPK